MAHVVENVRGSGRVQGIICAGTAFLMAVGACADQPTVREVPVTREVPTTVETVRTVEVTREVPVTQEVRVPVEVPKTVEVTRVVQVPQTVEVTRDVPVTRIVVATPSPMPAATPIAATPAAAMATPAPTPAVAPTPEPPPTATPSPKSSSRFPEWTMTTEQLHDRKLVTFRKQAAGYGVLPEAPSLIYRCDTRGQRALYVDWRHPIVTGGHNIGQYSEDAFREYRNDYLSALLDYTDGLIDFTGDLNLSQWEQRDLDDLWKKVVSDWLRVYDEPIEPANLTEYVRDVTDGRATIRLDFYREMTTETGDPRPPHILQSITGHWFVSHHHTRMSNIGELRPAYRDAFGSQPPDDERHYVIRATAEEPEQPIDVLAEWHVDDLLNVMAHCERAAN